MRTPRFEIFRGKNNEFFFRLKAKNGKIILQSESYTAKHNCISGIISVRVCSQDPDQFFIDFPFERGGHWYFNLLAENNEIIGTSETYTSKSSARKGIASVRRCAPIAEIVDLTGEK